jgi:hypothetical protein
MDNGDSSTLDRDAPQRLVIKRNLSTNLSHYFTLVLDEAHLYSGSLAAKISLLLRVSCYVAVSQASECSKLQLPQHLEEL